MSEIAGITFDSNIMGGKPCIRGMRVTAGMVLGMLASGHSRTRILELYPYLEDEDINAAVTFFVAYEPNRLPPAQQSLSIQSMGYGM